MVEIQPTDTHPLPFDLSPELPKTHKDSVAIAANTVDLIEQLGGGLDYSAKDLQSAAALINTGNRPSELGHVNSPAKAKALSVLVKQFDFQAFVDVQQARHYITNKLIEISDCGDPKLELKALELLGKHSDIGLFTERSEVTVNYKDSSDLEKSIKDRLRNLLSVDVVDAKPLISELELETQPEPTPEEPTTLLDIVDELEANPDAG